MLISLILKTDTQQINFVSGFNHTEYQSTSIQQEKLLSWC